MDQRRAAGALLALFVCIASTTAAPTVSNQTGLDLYDGSPDGCYYNFQHYGEGDRIMTNEPCLNCTCHNRMLMCYLRVCPFTKPIGQDCTVEKRADQCCPIITCPDVPVDLLTSTSTTSPAEYGATGLGKLDKFGCSINGKYFPEGSKVPPTPNKPCEHCYCIRNMTTCVMQECTLHVDGCTPIYHKDVCCPVRYSCDHPEDSTLLLDDMTTTVRPTPGFLLTTTTLSPVTQMSQDCVHDDQMFPDGALIRTEKACEHCYCMKGDIVCVVQECGTPMENEGKNCTSQPPREGQCCPDTYICEGDEVSPEPLSEFSTQSPLEELTTISPPRRVGVEGSGYRNEPDELAYTEGPSIETEPEGSGYESLTEPAVVGDNAFLTSETPEVSSVSIDESLDSSKTTIRTPILEEVETTTEPDKGLNTVPSDAIDDDIYKPSITEKIPVEESKATETTLTSDIKPTTPGDVFMPVVTTKDEETLITTESAFKKEDTLGEPTEIYDLREPVKVPTQANIEKETEDEVTTSKTKAPFMEEIEKQTTLSSEVTQKAIEEDIPLNELTTESVIEVTTLIDSKSTDKLATDFDLGQSETTKPSVEKIDMPEITISEQNEIEDITTTLSPARIPGEGDCLLNDITYRNNSNVPSSNNCHTSCKCVSSIVKCDPIICSPPPEYMDNCQPTYDSPDSCCPTYVCHTGETMPPQPHSQMSGTDSSMPSSPIECHGDECEVKKDDHIPVGSDCGSAGCADGYSGIPEAPSKDCHDGKCLLPTQPCPNGDCQEKPVSDCENGKCGIKPENESVNNIPICENESDCKGTVPDVPLCEGEGCVNVNIECSGTDCSTGVIKQPCINGNCEETSVAQCENGKCGIEPEIVPVKDTPLCENESDCKGTIPEVPSCEGEGCVNVNLECSGTDCNTDIIEHPKQDEEKCEGDCKKPEDETIQPCTETSCRRKEPGELGSSLPLDCLGSDCTQQIPSEEDEIHKPSTKLPVDEEMGIKSTQQLEITTTRYEIQTATEDASDQKPTDVVEQALKESSTSVPQPQATEVPAPLDDAMLGTEPSSQLDQTTESKLEKDDTDTKPIQMMGHDSTTLETLVPVTEETRIDDKDRTTKEPQETATEIQEGLDTQSPVTESQDVTSRVDLEESHEKGTTQDAAHSASTESSYVTEIYNTHTATPQESSTIVLKTEGTDNEPQEHGDKYTTKVPEQVPTETSIPHESGETDVYKVTEQPVPYTQGIELASTESLESNVDQDVTKSDVMEQTNVSINDITESNEIVEKATEISSVEPDEDKITTEIFQHELTTEGYISVTAPHDHDLVTKISEVPTTNSKIFGDNDVATSETPEIYNTEKQDVFAESPVDYVTESVELSTKLPALPDQEAIQTQSPELTTDETIRESEVPVSEREYYTTSTKPVLDTKVTDESTTQASLSEEKSTISEPADKPIHDVNENEIPAESPEIKVTQATAQEPSEMPVTQSTLQKDQYTQEPDSQVTGSDETETEKSDTLLTERPSMIAVDELIPAQEITEQQEISTEEPIEEPIAPVTDKISPEYIPVYPESTSDLGNAQPDIINEIPDVAPYTQKPLSEEDMGMTTEIPDLSGLNEVTKVSEESGTKSPNITLPETATENEATKLPEVFSETPLVEEVHKDKLPISTESPVTESSESSVIKEKQDNFDAFTMKTTISDGTPETTSVPDISVTEQQKEESLTTEKLKEQPSEDEYEQTTEPEKHLTVSIIQEPTVASVTQQNIPEYSTQSEGTESDTPYATSAPESHLKEPQKPVTATTEPGTTESHDISVSVPLEKLSPDKTSTENLFDVSTGAPEQVPIKDTSVITTDETPEEKPESPQSAYTQTPDESSTVLLEVVTESTQVLIPVKPQKSDSELQEETPIEKSTEKSDKEEEAASQSSNIPDEVTTSKSSNEQDKITEDGLQETMTTTPEKTQESSTRTPQDITASAMDSDLQEKYTTSVAQETTSGVVSDVITYAPDRQQPDSHHDESTGKPFEEEDVENPTTSKAQLVLNTGIPSEQSTEDYKPATEEPIAHVTLSSDTADKETMTVSTVLPTEMSTEDENTIPDVVELEEHSHKPVEEISTIAPTDNDVTTGITEENYEEKQKPQITTEKQTDITVMDEEKIFKPSDEISPDITMDVSVIPHEPTPLPSGEAVEQQTDILTTSQPAIQDGDQRFGDESSQKEQQPTQASPQSEQSPAPVSEPEFSEQTERAPTDIVTESELPPKTAEPSTETDEDESLTQKPDDSKPEVTPQEQIPEENPTVKPQDEPAEKPLESTEKPLEESSEKPEQKPSENPEQEPESKPMDETDEKPLETEKKPTEKPLNEFEGTPTEYPTEEKPTTELDVKLQEEPEENPLEIPEKIPELPDRKSQVAPQEKPQDLPEEKPEGPKEKPEESHEEIPEDSKEKPQEVPKEKPVPEKQPQELPEEKPQEEPEKTTQVEPEQKPFDVPDEKPQEMPEENPTVGLQELPEEKPQEVPEQKPLNVPDDKQQEEVDEKPQEMPEEKPHEIPGKTPQEMPSDIPQEMPEEKPQEIPEEKPQEMPENKPQEMPDEKPQEMPEENPTVGIQELPEEKPQEVPEQKPLNVPDDKQEEEVDKKPQNLPEEKPQEMPEEKPQEIPDKTPQKMPSDIPQEMPEEKPQEMPEEKLPETPEEKPQEMPEEKLPEMPKEKPQEMPEDKVPEEKPQEMPEDKVPEEKPQEMPEDKVPEEKPQEMPEEKPQEMPEDKLQDIPEEKPQEIPEEKPLPVPEEKLQDMPEEKPQDVPEEKPQEVPEQKPEESSEEKPAEPASTATPEISKPGLSDMQPTDEVPDDDNQFPPSAGTSGYGTEPDYVEEDQAFGPGTCRYGGKVYVSAQQIPRDDPCDFCFCFRSDIICLQQSCPPPIHGCHEEPIQGFCCPRYECPVAMATTLNVTTTTTTTTTTLPPHFLPHAYKGAAQRRGCQIKGHTYKVGEVVRASSGPCLHCTCGGDGQMKCDPKVCTPEPMLRQMIAAAVSSKRRR